MWVRTGGGEDGQVSTDKEVEVDKSNVRGIIIWYHQFTSGRATFPTFYLIFYSLLSKKKNCLIF